MTGALLTLISQAPVPTPGTSSQTPCQVRPSGQQVPGSGVVQPQMLMQGQDPSGDGNQVAGGVVEAALPQEAPFSDGPAGQGPGRQVAGLVRVGGLR